MKFSIWLMPSEEYFDQLKDKILQLSITHQSSAFDPHVTVFTGDIQNENYLPNAISRMAQQFSPITLTVEGVGARELYIQSLFYYFNVPEELKSLSGCIRENTDCGAPYELRELKEVDPRIPAISFPHLSLLYKEMPLAEKQALIPTVSPPLFQEIVFDRMVTMIIPTPAQALEEWYAVSDNVLGAGMKMRP